MPTDAALDILLRESHGDLVVAAEAYRKKTGYSDAEWDLYKAAAAAAEEEAKEAELAEQAFFGDFSDSEEEEDDAAYEVGTTEGRAAIISCEFSLTFQIKYPVYRMRNPAPLQGPATGSPSRPSVSPPPHIWM